MDLWSQSYAPDKKCSIKINQREIIQKRNKLELWFLCTALRVIAIKMHTKFEVIWTNGKKNMFRTRNAPLKINQRAIIQKRNKVELWFLSTALRVIAINMHTKFEVIWTYGDKVMLRTRNAL